MTSPTHPQLRHQGSVCQLLVGQTPTLLLAGELHNSSASSLGYVTPLLDKLVRCGLNTVLAPVYWELLEPEEGHFDFTLVDDLVQAARARSLMLVPLWFGTLKNAVSCYAPGWVRRDTRRFPRAETAPGVPSLTVSPFCEEAARCDARAFAALMRRLKTLDPAGQTVVMVQVENETGILKAARDCCAAATQAFQAAVPRALLTHLAARRDVLRPELRQAWEAAGARAAGTWREVFGSDAEEVFMGWHVTRFVETVAAAGRREYDLPLYTNTWLVGGPGFPPGSYPSGGPVSKLFDVWQAAAPSIAFIAPDIYRHDFRDVCADYTTCGNPLFIPEARNEPVAAANALYAFGRHAALGFAPFAIEDIAEDHPLVETYRALADLMPVLTTAQCEGRTTAFLQEADDERQTAVLGDYHFYSRPTGKRADLAVPGCALVIDVGDDTFYCLGRSLTLTFAPHDGSQMSAELLDLDEGTFEAGVWRHGRRLNGDETYHATAIRLGTTLSLCRFRLFTLPAPE